MPHSSFKRNVTDNGAGVGKSPCGQTIDYAIERDMKMKLQMHFKFCSNPPKRF